DSASFACKTPGLTVTKVCEPQGDDGTNEVDLTVTNTGSADLANCVATDKVFPNDKTCPSNPSDASTDVSVPAIGNITHGANPVSVKLTGAQAVHGLTADACNTVSVTCDIVGSVDATGQVKKLTAKAQDVCEVQPCAIQVDKQVKCGAGAPVDVGFNPPDDGVNSCIGWNAFTVDGVSTAAETVTVQYQVKNNGTRNVFGCTLAESNTSIKAPATVGDLTTGATSALLQGTDTSGNPLTCSDALVSNGKEPD